MQMHHDRLSRYVKLPLSEAPVRTEPPQERISAQALGFEPPCDQCRGLAVCSTQRGASPTTSEVDAVEQVNDIKYAADATQRPRGVAQAASGRTAVPVKVSLGGLII